MKKNYFLSIILFLLIINTLNAQTWQWGKSGGSNTNLAGSNIYEEIIDMAVDQDNNVYILSPIGSSNPKVDGIAKITSGSVDFIISSFDCSGTYRWSRVIGGSGNDEMQRLDTDAQGNVYAIGKVNRSYNGIPGFQAVHFRGEDNIQLTLPYSQQDNQHQESLFIVKYNSNGDFQWVKMPQPANVGYVDSMSLNRSVDLAVDPEGNSYWLCLIPPGVYANGEYEANMPQNTIPHVNLIIFKYDTNGNFVGGYPFQMKAEGGAIASFKMARNHNTGTIYIAGSLGFSGTYSAVTFNDEQFANGSYVAAFTSEGSFLWKHDTNNFDGNISDITIDSNNSVYVTGYYRAIMQFNGVTLPGIANSLDDYPFVMKLNKDGGVIWHSTANSTGTYFRPYGIAVSNNEVAITGFSNGLHWGDNNIEQVMNDGTDITIVRFDKANGTATGAEKITSNNGTDDWGTAIEADNYGNFLVGGRFANFLYVTQGQTLLNNSPGTDFVITQFGKGNCDCVLPQPEFTAQQDAANNLQYSFTYTGEDYDSITWYFEDGGYATDVSETEHTFTNSGSYTVCAVTTNSCGSEEYCMEVEAILGLKNNSLNSVTVYPNPAETLLNINTAENLGYTLYSILGVAVKSGNITPATAQIQLNGITAGVYTLKLQNQKGDAKVVKIIKN